MRKLLNIAVVTCVILGLLASPGFAATSQEVYTIVLKDHKFDPPQLNIPAGQKIKLIIDNQDPTPEEFESYELNREKVVAGNKQITVYIGPLKSGSYKYFGEFHQNTAQGTIVAQ